MGDCPHPEDDRRYALASATFFCRVCKEVVELTEQAVPEQHSPTGGGS